MIPRLPLSPVLLLLAIATSLHPALAQENPYPPTARERTEWCDIWVAHANEDKLPRVLLIGDSITRAYSAEVDTLLSGKAYVARLATSAFISDPALLAQVSMVLANNHFDVIHFNNGMHGWQHSEEEYRQAFPAFIKAIQTGAPDARLIWASTTPLRTSPPVGLTSSTQPTDDRIRARNQIAADCLKPLQIPTDDLFTPMLGHPDYHSDNIHFAAKAVSLQAAQVAAAIEKLLPPGPPR